MWPPASHPFPSRRSVLALLATAFAEPALAGPVPVVTILGDSITAGYGLPAASALPAQLQGALARLGRPANVRGAGVSGDTTAGGLARVDFSVQSDTRLAIVALGGNDLLRGLDPRQTRANLIAIARKLQRRRIRVMIAGLRAPVAIGAGYASDFNRVFADAAHATGAILYPDLLAGVEGRPALNQADGIHPNPQGVRAIVARLAPAVAKAFR